MNRILLLIPLSIIFTFPVFGQGGAKPVVPVEPKIEIVNGPTGPPPEDTIKTVVEEQAEFPGGTTAMMAFIRENLKYPEYTAEEGIQGKCYLHFVVTKQGEIQQIKVLRSIQGYTEFDKEAIRVISIMPDWIPAKIGGKPVDSYFNLPIRIEL